MAARSCTIVISAAPLAERAHEIVEQLVSNGWRVAVVPTENARTWINQDAITQATATLGTVDPRRTDAAVVIPATFNTINKTVLGVADTHAHSLLSELLNTPAPLLWVPMINSTLWAHPSLAQHLEVLRSCGTHFLDPHNGEEAATALTSGTGAKVAEQFDPGWVITRLDNLVSSR